MGSQETWKLIPNLIESGSAVVENVFFVMITLRETLLTSLIGIMSALAKGKRADGETSLPIILFLAKNCQEMHESTIEMIIFSVANCAAVNC